MRGYELSGRYCYFLGWGILFMVSNLLSKVPVIVAHRGASAYEPENTLRSFKRALTMGAPMIELDVYTCKTGEIVVIHDATLDRTAHRHGDIRNLTWSQLQKYTVGKGEKIPLLRDVLTLINRRATVIIELKEANCVPGVVALIDECVHRQNWSYDDFIISSFDHYAVLDVKTRCPDVKTGVIFVGSPIGHADLARRAHADYMFMSEEYLLPACIQDAHRTGIKVFAWTVNQKARAQELSLLGIDGIVTNYPDLLKA